MWLAQRKIGPLAAPVRAVSMADIAVPPPCIALCGLCAVGVLVILAGQTAELSATSNGPPGLGPLDDADGAPDPRVCHRACPVPPGHHKFGCNVWIADCTMGAPAAGHAAYPVGGPRPIGLPGPSHGPGRRHAPRSAA